MPVRSFVTSATDAYDRGHELGVACSAGVHTAWQRYRELWAAFGVIADEVRSVGESVLDPVQVFSSTLRAEMAGIAAGSGLADWQLGALNARSELLALGDQRLLAAGRLPGEAVSECSALVRLPRAGAPVTAQTWDWHTSLQDSWFVWTLPLPGGRTVSTLTEYGIVGKIGVRTDTAPDGSSRGAIGVHFNALRHGTDSGLGGVPVHLVARRVLDEARTGAEAVAIASTAQVTASAAVTVTAPDETGSAWTARTIELHPGGPAVLAQSVGAAGGWLAHTNHFVADATSSDAGLTSEVSTSRERLDRVARLAREDSGTTSAQTLAQQLAQQLATHDLGERSVCVHGFPDAPLGQRSATLAVVVAEPARGRLHVHAGKPCEARADSWWSSVDTRQPNRASTNERAGRL